MSSDFRRMVNDLPCPNPMNDPADKDTLEEPGNNSPEYSRQSAMATAVVLAALIGLAIILSRLL